MSAKDVLVVKTDALLSREIMHKFYQLLVDQMKNGVVLLPPYFEAEIIHVPENVEIRIESKNDSVGFLTKNFNIPKGE